MNRFFGGATAAIALLSSVSALANVTAGPVTLSYVPNSLAESTIKGGPWNLHQTSGANTHDASGIIPTGTAPPYSGSGFPYAGYCTNGVVQTNPGVAVMQPFYFPFVRKAGNYLEGFFDYRPRNEEEATVAAISLDNGKTWIFHGKALSLNSYCPYDASDPDNQFVSVGGTKTAYGSDPNSAADNGLGHAFALSVGSNQYIYHLNRANGHIDFDQLVVHKLSGSATNSLASLPAAGYVSPLSTGGYPALEPKAQSTNGLITPDAILGAIPYNAGKAVIYVSKDISATAEAGYASNQVCGKTPSWALTNHVTGKAKKANHDVITIRVATTTDGINFTDAGAASGLMDQKSTAFNAIRWLGSGSIVPLADGRYGLFFGAGNCLDNDSDGFHFMGYAETTNVVNQPGDLLKWKVIYGFDNPILSTDTVTDPSTNISYPANAPLVNVSKQDALTPGQVSPFVATGGFNTNFFSGRVYDPQVTYTDAKTVTIVFAGYNTPAPSYNLGDYRSIGRLQLQFPAGYFKQF